MPARWTRSLTANMGLEIQDFVKGLKAALCEDSVIESFHRIITEPLKKEITELRASLEKKEEKIKALENQVDSLEQYSRRNSLRINGFPENDSEDLYSEAVKLANDTLKVSPPISISDIDRVHRIGPRASPGKPAPRPIILKMATYRGRASIYKNRSKLRQCQEKIFINEDLTKTRSRLFWEARQFKKEKKILDCWTYDGTLVIKDLHGKIKTIQDIQQLRNLCSR